MDIEINWHRPPETPERSGAYLCIVSEPDTLNGQEGAPMYDILFYSAANGALAGGRGVFPAEMGRNCRR